MRFRPYGNTGIQTSEIGMGGMRFENPDQIEEMAQVVLHAFDKGVNYFDTAPFYCKDKSENIFGVAISEMKKSGKPFYISTKTGVSRGEEVRPQFERSLERLGVDAVDFYHVWCLVRPEQLPERKLNGVLDEFRKLKEEGLVRHICVSTHLGDDQVATMLDQAEGLFEGMLIGLNAINFNFRLKGVRAAAQRGMGVATMNTLGGGMLADHAQHYRYLMREGDESILEPALRFNLSVPEVSVALVGFRNKRDVDTAFEAYEKVELLSDAEMRDFKTGVVESSEDFCTQCNYCRDCPVEIPIVRFMEAYNGNLLDDSQPQSVLNKLRYHWGIPEVEAALAACTECRQCENVCTQHLPILKRFETLRQMERESKAQKAKHT